MSRINGFPFTAALLFLGVAGAPPAGAQIARPTEVPVTERATFTIVGNDLLISVATPLAGTLQVVRGGSGAVNVRARADGGVPGIAWPGRGRARLRLTGAGAGALSYVVVVPERVRVGVLLPGRDLPEMLRTHQAHAAFEWEAEGAGKHEGEPPRGKPDRLHRHGEGVGRAAGSGSGVDRPGSPARE